MSTTLTTTQPRSHAPRDHAATQATTQNSSCPLYTLVCSDRHRNSGYRAIRLTIVLIPPLSSTSSPSLKIKPVNATGVHNRTLCLWSASDLASRHLTYLYKRNRTRTVVHSPPLSSFPQAVQVKFSSWVFLDLLPHVCLHIPYLVPNTHISLIFVLASLS